jgi:glycosyltransferase involved in cell wall biosynthesis
LIKQLIKKSAGLLLRRIFPRLKNNSPNIDVHTKLAVNIVTTWKSRCGIAVYSHLLASELKKKVQLQVTEVPYSPIFSPYFFILGYKAGKAKGIVHVQFAGGMFPGLKLWRLWNFENFTIFLYYMGLSLGHNLVVSTIHEVPEKRNTGKLGRAYSKFLSNLIFNVPNLIIALSEESKNQLVRNFGVSSSKIKIIPIGCVEALQILDKGASKKKLKLEGKTVLTIPGFVSNNHGHDLVVSVLPKLGKNVHLLIAGGSQTEATSVYYEKLKKLVDDNQCSERVTFLEDFPISFDVWNATDIAILPYRYSAESLTLRLLVSYKVPTITSDLNVFRKIKKDYDCIELFQTNNQNDLLIKIESLMSNLSIQNRLREGCQKMYNENNWSEIASRHIQEYLGFFSIHPDAIYTDKKQLERIDWLKQNVSGNTLEIGCAGGFITNYVNADIGLDINPWRIKFAKYTHPEKDFIVASAFLLPFVDNAFETILVPEILEHVPLSRTEIIISESQRIAKKIAISLPNADKVNYDPELVENVEHLWFPTKKIVLNLVKDCSIQYTKENDFMLVLWSK